MKYFAFMFLLACQSQTETKVFNNAKYNYEFTYLSTWTIRDQGAFVDVLEPGEGERPVVAIATDITEGLQIEQVYKKNVSGWFEEQSEGVVKAEGSLTLNGRPAKWMEFQNNLGTTYLVYVIYCGDRYFLITAMAPTKRFPEYKSKFEDVINSMKIK